MKIDVFPHILPRKYFERLLAVAPPGLALQKRMSGIPVLVDLDLRFTMMDRWDGYVQVLTLANPPIEVVAPPAAIPVRCPRYGTCARIAATGQHICPAPVWHARHIRHRSYGSADAGSRCIEL